MAFENFISLCPACHGVYDNGGLVTPEYSMLANELKKLRKYHVAGDAKKMADKLNIDPYKMSRILKGYSTDVLAMKKVIPEYRILRNERAAEISRLLQSFRRYRKKQNQAA